ncbi:succinylglutamate desuccinylase/aspartoacylase family protein [Paraburkholderia sp. JPY432]|uniref:succinylglutamate desuccinylase/aspartoacylase family protein n=1 Tax=Paraburkholderia youngii TaxID=2782701 RepID=UPI0015958CA1|nr:succinylglutamate desuccinylase/aspartoacylase family protein [Paraburkholderia youngii]NVH75277.1 succinylglutamate desuccinylase/aspartoacylase family protein [Paraburkholderia youngii]
MQTQTHPLIAPSLGTARELTSFHYGPGGGQKIYIQSSLHADELPGMLVSWSLRRKLAALEAADKLRGEVVVVPVPNPIGLNQHLLGQMLGRFETGSAQNFNRNFYDLAELVLPTIESRLTGDIDENRAAIRAAMREALDAQKPTTELGSQRLALQKLSYDADVVLDLHCDWEAAMHLYTNPDLWPEVEPLARYIDAKASLLALNSVGNPFDEIHSFCWSDLRGRFGERFPIPNGGISVTIELRGQRDVSYEYAEKDAQAIIEYLTLRGVVDGEPAPLPPLEFAATPLAGAEPLVAPISGVLVYRCEVGTWVDVGQEIADIVDPLTDHVVTIKNTVAGLLYARHLARFATAGLEFARIAGATPFRSGSLLSN